jgi:hypothetical protein
VRAGFAFFATGAYLLTTKPAAARENPVAARHVFSETIVETYDFKFGKDKSFLPSNAITDTGFWI